jgi:NADPH-dependent glutamate synthase beta subunit-like oxidoreductase
MSELITPGLVAVEIQNEYQDPNYAPAPCQQTCPVGTDVPSYVGLIWEGRYEAAFDVISQNNPFATVCGRVCSKPCEKDCRRGESDGAVGIRALKRYVCETVGKAFKRPPAKVTKKKTVGIVGAGPAGLTAAQDLAEEGYVVHVYEKRPRLGGMMAAGIPPFRLPAGLLDQDIGRLLEHCPGIQVHTGCELGKDVSLAELKKRHDAVLLAVGLWKDRRLNVPGEDEGIQGLHGIGFLTDINDGAKTKLKGKVVVIGGGNVAMDVARTARRVGPKSVDLYCLESREQMPAWQHEILEAEAEGIVMNPSWGPKRILHDGKKVKGIEFMRCVSVFDEAGRFSPKFDPNVTTKVDCDAILLSIGLSAESGELEKAGLLQRGYVRSGFDTMRTEDPKVFAAGDGAFGPSAIVTAMQHGHRAAHYIRAHLEGAKKTPAYRTPYRTCRVSVAQDPRWEKLNREEPVFCGIGDDPSLFAQCDLTYDPETAQRQAARCLRCDAETGSADYTRRTRDLMHMMARTKPGEVEKQCDVLRARLRPRDNPFPTERGAHLDDVVFLAAGLTRLVIDPYREACSTETRIGGVTLGLPYLFAGFDGAPDTVRDGLARAAEGSGCGYVGRSPLGGKVPWVQLLTAKDKPDPKAAGVVYLVGKKFQAVKPAGLKKGQLAGLAVAASALPKAIPFALENGFHFLLLDGTSGIDKPWVELEGAPDLTVLRDAIKILRELNREEDIALVYFGGMRTGTDVAKVLAMNANAGVFGVSMALALGGSIEDGAITFPTGASADELAKAGANWIKGTVQETAIIARCTGKTNVHNLEPEDMRTITLATQTALGIPLASGGGARGYF